MLILNDLTAHVQITLAVSFSPRGCKGHRQGWFQLWLSPGLDLLAQLSPFHIANPSYPSFKLCSLLPISMNLLSLVDTLGVVLCTPLSLSHSCGAIGQYGFAGTPAHNGWVSGNLVNDSTWSLSCFCDCSFRIFLESITLSSKTKEFYQPWFPSWVARVTNGGKQRTEEVPNSVRVPGSKRPSSPASFVSPSFVKYSGIISKKIFPFT